MNVSLDQLLEKTFGNFQKLTPALIAVAIFTGLILFLPEKLLTIMSLQDLSDSHRRIIGITFLFSVTLCITVLVLTGFSKLQSTVHRRVLLKDLRKKLCTLSPGQKRIIVTLMNSKEKSIKLDSNSGDTIYLLSNHFIHQPQQLFSVGRDNKMTLVYTPEPWLIDLFFEEPQLFK